MVQGKRISWQIYIYIYILLRYFIRDVVYIHHDWVFLCVCLILQPVEVSTKGGRRGRIKEPIGTHGMVLFVTR